jgi:hypothetical protein
MGPVILPFQSNSKKYELTAFWRRIVLSGTICGTSSQKAVTCPPTLACRTGRLRNGGVGNFDSKTVELRSNTTLARHARRRSNPALGPNTSQPPNQNCTDDNDEQNSQLHILPHTLCALLRHNQNASPAISHALQVFTSPLAILF